MTTIAHPLAARHHVFGAIVTAAVTAWLSVGLTLALRTSSAAPTARADRALCQQFAQATPGSPAAFRLADVISTQGSC